MEKTEISLSDLYNEIKSLSHNMADMRVLLATITTNQNNDREKMQRLFNQINDKDGIIDRISALEKFEVKVVTMAAVGGFVGGLVVQYFLK